jgi:hypothetical protein
MPRVVPSDVVALIDKMFPWASCATPAGQSSTQLGIQHAGAVAALVEAAEQVPAELIVMEREKYVGLVAGLAAARAALRVWATGDRHSYLSAIPGFDNEHAVRLIREAFAVCPDDAPSPTTQELGFIKDADLRQSIRLDMSSAHRDLAQGEWKGTTVLAGSAIEALLLWALQEHEKQNQGAIATAAKALLASKVLSGQPPTNVEDWNLHQYAEVASHLKLIEDDTAKLVRLAKDFRNLIHAGRAKRLGQKCDRATALGAVAAAEAVARDLTS